MTATVLKSEQAVEMSIFIVRAFVKLREVAVSEKEIAQKIRAIDLKLMKHDDQIGSLVRAIRQLISPTSVTKKRQIGFNTRENK